MIDTHAHLDGDEFVDDIHEVINSAKEAGVEKVFIPNINLQTVNPILRLCKEYAGYLYPMIGLHPEDVKPQDLDEVLNKMEQELEDTCQTQCPFIAIGEVGLDYYWDDKYKDLQIYAFEQQVILALKYHLPLMIHSRNAHDDIVAIIRRNYDDGLSGVFHCFTGSCHEANELLDFDSFVLGIGGVLTFKKSILPDVLAECVPLEKIVLETDSPYMAPVPNRGKRNEPKLIRDIALKLSQVYHTDLTTIQNITNENVKRIFNV